MEKKILIIGNSAKVYSLARKMSEANTVFVAPGSKLIDEFATSVDIREDSLIELLEFVMENDIDLTIPFSEKSMNSDIVKLFLDNNQPIFAPSKDSYSVISDKAFAKKFLYKLMIPTPKFGIFEKQNMVMDYIKNLNKPFVIKTNDSSSAAVFTSPKLARNIVDSLFAEKTQKIIIEDYIYGTPFCFYAITDGYKALPFGSSIIYKHSLEGDGGQLTNGMGACAPNYKLSIEQEYYLMDNVIYPTLEYLESERKNYVGIIGVNGIITDENDIQILGYESTMQDCDCCAVLECLDVDLYSLFLSCTIGSFSDEVDFISQKDISATSIVLYCKNKENNENIIEGLELLDDDVIKVFYPTVNKNKYLEMEANYGPVLSITALRRTNSASTVKAYEEVNAISFKGLTYRKDLCKSLESSF